MITVGPITLPRSAAELLDATDGYGAGAKLWLESSATGAGSWSSVGSEALVAGTEALYFVDPSGTSDTWYRTYLSKSDGSSPSAYSDAFQPSAQPAGYVTVASAKSWLRMADAEDDAQLAPLVASVNAELVRRVGIYLGPSADTLRLYDGRDAVRSGTRLWVPGGIRTLTQVRLADVTGGTWETATLADFLLRPLAHQRRTGMPAMRVDVSDQSDSVFSDGYANVELTGTFGYAAPPDDVVQLAHVMVARMWRDRDAGMVGDVPSASKYVYKDDADMLMGYRAESFPMAS